MSIYQSATNSTSLPVIAGVEITTDAEGRFNLNALHKASGLGDHKRPSKWMATDSAKQLISELEKQSPFSGSGHEVVKTNNGGTNQGTFAHELLAVSYASWISPSFHLQVNQVFLDYRTGKLQPIQHRDPMEVLNDPDAMRGLLLSYSEKVIALQNKVEEAKPVIEAFDKIATADGSLNMTESAKVLQMRPVDLRRWLHAHRWIYRRNGSKNWLGYQDRIQSGLIEHKITPYEKTDGSEGISEQVRITPKGITILAKALSVGDVA